MEISSLPTMPAPGEEEGTKRLLHTSTVRNTVALIPSAISYSPFSLGRVKLYSLPGPNILKDTRQQCYHLQSSWVLHRGDCPLYTSLGKTHVPIVFKTHKLHTQWWDPAPIEKLPPERKRGSNRFEHLGARRNEAASPPGAPVVLLGFHAGKSLEWVRVASPALPARRNLPTHRQLKTTVCLMLLTSVFFLPWWPSSSTPVSVFLSFAVHHLMWSVNP